VLVLGLSAVTATARAAGVVAATVPNKNDGAREQTDAFRTAASVSPAPVLDRDKERNWRALFQEARRAFGGGQFERARSLYLQAYDIKPSPKILANLAQVEIALREYVAAATHADMALRELGENLGVERDLAAAKRHIGTLDVATNVDGALVEIDGKPQGLTPLQGVIYVEPGEHYVSVTSTHALKVDRRIQLEPGMAQRIEIALVRERVGKPVSPHAGTRTTEEILAGPRSASERTNRVRGGSRPNPAALVAGGLLSVGGIGSGIWLNSRAESKYDAASAKRRDVGSSGCREPDGASALRECRSILEDLKDGDRARNWATASFALGGAALVGTALYWFWPRGEHSRGSTSSRSHAVISVDAGSTRDASWFRVSGHF
jgi:tetratricopeptide (TPR) repeat protein